MKTKDLTEISLFTAIIVMCAYITIPYTIPFTMQTFGIFLAISVLGKNKGSLAILIYLLIGAIGIPVFSGFRGGLGVLLSYTGGYIIGFLAGGYISGLIGEYIGKTYIKQLISMLAGLLVCYIFGSLWFYFVYTNNTGSIGIISVLTTCVVPFIIPDIAKIALAVYIGKKVKRFVR
ncbi:MAG: biotin transporter BioY [Monoglobales bacterium]